MTYIKYLPIELIRKQKLATLVSEHGGQRKLADLIGKSEAQISQWLTGVRLPSGKERAISSTTAREIEKLLSLPENWMDMPFDVYAEDVETPGWPFETISESDWNEIPEKTKGIIEGYAKFIIDQELAKAKQTAPKITRNAA